VAISLIAGIVAPANLFPACGNFGYTVDVEFTSEAPCDR
jgi:hypothetical protein